MGLELSGFDAMGDFFQGMKQEFPKEVDRLCLEAAIQIREYVIQDYDGQTGMKSSLDESVWKEPPRVQTGRLRASMNYKQVKEGEYLIGTNVEYAPNLEFGTTQTKVHPFLGPAVERHRPDFARALADLMKDATDA